MYSVSFAKDAIERILSTVVQVFLAAALTAATEVVVGNDGGSLDAISTAIMAGWGAGLAAIKAYLAKIKTGTLSPASLAKSG